MEIIKVKNLTLNQTIKLLTEIKNRDYNNEIEIVLDNGKFYIQNNFIILKEIQNARNIRN